jgi:cob(I)alamin adenosyltransferase
VKVYTRTGDEGTTALGDGRRVSKGSPRVAAYGDVDELNAALAVLLAEGVPEAASGPLSRAQHTLFEVGAFLANPARTEVLTDAARDPGWLERWIDAMESELPPLRNFVLPGGTRAASLAQQARTVCRRAERAVVHLQDEGEGAVAVVPLLNRLSDALFVLARWLNRRADVTDVIWQGGRP